MPLTSLKVAFTHCDKHYRGAHFIPNVTTSPKVNEAQATHLHDQYVSDTMTKLAEHAPYKIHSNVFGTFIGDSRTEVETTGWGNSQTYLRDTALPITEGTFMYMLEVLFPEHWHGVRGSFESFQMVELQCGDITSTLIRYNSMYWHIYAKMGTPQTQLKPILEARMRDLVEMNVGHAEHSVRSGLCSCCGAHIAKIRQWPNRDTGYGVCDTCVPLHSREGADLVELMDLMGLPGYHFSVVIPQHHNTNPQPRSE